MKAKARRRNLIHFHRQPTHTERAKLAQETPLIRQHNGNISYTN
jgi:hypothetical protein